MGSEFTHGIRIPPFQDYGTFMGKYPYDVMPMGPKDAWVPGATNAGRFAEIPLDRYLYERLDWSQFLADVNKLGLGYGPYQLSNPPFLGAGQMLGSSEGPAWLYAEPDASPNNVYGPGHKAGLNRVLRGYIRRRDTANNPGDPRMYARLYFMFNPDQIQRTYISQLDVPNADFVDRGDSAGNLNYFAMSSVEFSLFFDRQVEVAKDATHPGVLVDLQVFDVLTREKGAPGMKFLKRGAEGLEWDDTYLNIDGNTGASTDTIVLNMDYHVAIVFSPNLHFEGVIRGATVVFEKFSTRMIPTRMTLSISLTLMAVTTAATQNNTNPGGGSSGLGLGSGGIPSDTDGNMVADPNAAEYNRIGRSTAAQFGRDLAAAQVVSYNSSLRLNWNGSPAYADCSSFIFFCYTRPQPKVLTGTTLRPVQWPVSLFGAVQAPDTLTLTKHIFDMHMLRFQGAGLGGSWPTWRVLGGAPWKKSVSTIKEDPSAFERAWLQVAAGDIICRSPSGPNGHIIMTAGNPVGDSIPIVHCTSGNNGTSGGRGIQVTTMTKDHIRNGYEYMARPQPKDETTKVAASGPTGTRGTGDWWAS